MKNTKNFTLTAMSFCRPNCTSCYATRVYSQLVQLVQLRCIFLLLLCALFWDFELSHVCEGLKRLINNKYKNVSLFFTVLASSLTNTLLDISMILVGFRRSYWKKHGCRFLSYSSDRLY